ERGEEERPGRPAPAELVAPSVGARVTPVARGEEHDARVVAVAAAAPEGDPLGEDVRRPEGAPVLEHLERRVAAAPVGPRVGRLGREGVAAHGRERRGVEGAARPRAQRLRAEERGARDGEEEGVRQDGGAPLARPGGPAEEVLEARLRARRREAPRDVEGDEEGEDERERRRDLAGPEARGRSPPGEERRRAERRRERDEPDEERAL